MTTLAPRATPAVDVPPGSPAVVAVLRRTVEEKLGLPVDVRVTADVAGHAQHLTSTSGAVAPDVAWPTSGTPEPRAVVAQHASAGVLTSVAARAPIAVDWSVVATDLDEAAAVLAVMVSDRVALTDLRQDVADLTAAMASREVIDQALGVVMAHRRCAPADALQALRVASQRRGEKVSVVAARIVAQVAGPQPDAPRPFVSRRHPSTSRPAGTALPVT
ncbi:ANTAR domain-containing protein [Cellulomonas sp. S1-8]|uniref:ANTAR domain-containing protein n=1 Tax=Cellulomonas sp. S1-8 TaxID=2904790 RepID=UPI002244041C|nr:ANTAR domain-containing protein [Cellulomonas sp. S1-8]UZN03948.1 ANTAR domain-containing protein [Cellulomonas sp. S1-8]